MMIMIMMTKLTFMSSSFSR